MGGFRTAAVICPASDVVVVVFSSVECVCAQQCVSWRTLSNSSCLVRLPAHAMTVGEFAAVGPGHQLRSAAAAQARLATRIWRPAATAIWHSAVDDPDGDRGRGAGGWAGGGPAAGRSPGGRPV